MCTNRRFVRLITHNVISAGGNDLNMVLRAMNHMHVDIGVLAETKLSHDKHTRNCEGHTVFSTKSDGFKGGIALFCRNSSQWTIEGIKAFGPDVIRWTVASGNRHWACLGIYMPPSEFNGNGDTLHWIEEATRNAKDHLIVMGDLNCNLRFAADSHGDDIRSVLSLLNLADVANHFSHPRGRWTWSQWRTSRSHSLDD